MELARLLSPEFSDVVTSFGDITVNGTGAIVGGKLGFGVVIGMPVTYLIVVGGVTGGTTSVCKDALLSQQCSWKRDKQTIRQIVLVLSVTLFVSIIFAYLYSVGGWTTGAFQPNRCTRRVLSAKLADSR